MADSPIIDAIGTVLGIASHHLDGHWCNGPGDESFFFADYRRNEASFKSLWALGKDDVLAHDVGDEFLDSFKGKRATIILVDHDSTHPVIPSDRLGRFVSALTWAHAFLFALDKRQHSTLPRIGILDLRGRNDTDAWAYSRFRTAPGISYFRGVGEMDRFVIWLGDVRKKPDAYRATQNSELSAELELALRMWSVGVGWSNDRASHHEINNLAGPLALAASCPDTSKLEILDAHNEPSGEVGPKRVAAAAMMRAFDWFGEFPRFAVQPQTRRADVSYMLLDDQYEHWSPVLAAALGGNIKSLVSKKITPAHATQAILDASQKFVDKSKDKGDIRPLRGKLYFSTPLEILFLDLRLFSKVDSSNEVELFRAIVETAEAAKSSNALCRNDIDADLTIVADWLKDRGAGFPVDTESREYLLGLSLLPQLLASLDDTYPIVLFSSTRQRLISDRLKVYDNVIQCLPKPSFSSYAESHIARAFAAGVAEALTHAESYISLRREIKSLCDIRCHMHENPLQLTPGNFVEVFFDEAEVSTERYQKWVQATVIAEYKGGSECSGLVTNWMRSRDVELSDASGHSKTRRIKWGRDADCLDKKLRLDGTNHYKPTAATWPNLGKILAALGECPQLRSLHVVTLEMGKSELNVQKRGNIDGGDPNFFATLRLLTECVLFDLLTPETSVGLRFATRIVKTDSVTKSNLRDCFGFSDYDFFSFDGTDWRRVLPPRVAHGLVDSCRQNRPQQGDPKMVFCDARSINLTKKFPNSEACSELHHLADLFATCALDNAELISSSLQNCSTTSTHLAEKSFDTLRSVATVAAKLQYARAETRSLVEPWKQFFESEIRVEQLGSIGRITCRRLADSLCDLESKEIGMLASMWH